ncbi:hypothetical protein DH2020_011549 [Rehmannia glutinosa]|uniref:RNase H type-1 domain-containing protein n=1 Tax=Rehmannia glutinosa TaxID=99300 RepID=A0ABR0XDV0_REHGL
MVQTRPIDIPYIWIIPIVAESFSQWLFRVLSCCKEEDVALILFILWSIWKQRNEEFWNKTHLSPEATVYAAKSFLYDWVQAKMVKGNVFLQEQADIKCPLWHKPPSLSFKCNVDAAIFQKENMVGFGMILRNDMAEFVVCRTTCLQGIPSVKEAEAMGLKEALSWIKELQLNLVSFEVDAKGVADSIRGDDLDLSEFGSLISDCKEILQECPSFSVCFVRR